ncbi:MAG: hypothetical protein GY715_19955 [Planctomycetes bacterium]|nr:hypothetical protein [Planctomycetota bacterium]
MIRSRWIPALAALLAVLVSGAAVAQDGDVLVEMDQFGLGGEYRAGEITGLRAKLTALPESGLDEATAVWVQWEVSNADGDIAEYGRPVTLTKGRPRRVWLYAPISPDTNPNSYWVLRVYEYADGERGGQLGGTRVNPPARAGVEVFDALVGVVGSSRMGLGQLRLGTATSTLTFTDHEDTIAVYGLRPEDLPDRWEGLKSLDVLAWSGAVPQDLPTAQADALREWVRRGGHLAISLPEDTNPWGLGEAGRTDLEDMLPTKSPRRDEEVRVSSLLPILSKSRGFGRGVKDPVLGLRVFKDYAAGFDALSNGYEPLIATPDGRVIVVQRLFGHGRITIIGFDMSQLTGTFLMDNNLMVSLPQADVFWNRVLGRRADTPGSSELGALRERERLTRSTPLELNVGTGQLFRNEINMSGRASAGLLMAVLLFIAYWIVAGPGGFYTLKSYKRTQHAWLFFAAAAGVFTAVAWGGVNLLRQNEVSVRHLTFLDHIARTPGDADEFGTDPQRQRAVSWLSVYLPGYGSTSIAIESEEASEGVPAARDLLHPWTPPREASHEFPNADRYRVDVSRNPDDYDLPTRSTATQLYANWRGGVDPGWGGIAEDPNDPIRVEIDPRGNETLRGSIMNEFTAPLEHMTCIWISSKRVRARRYATSGEDEQIWVRSSGEMLNVGRMWRPLPLDGGDTYSMPSLTPEHHLEQNIYGRYVRPFEGSNLLGGATSLDLARRRTFMEMLSIYRQLRPPQYLKAPKETNPPAMIAKRMLGRELDLSAWFNRPCLIVMGFVDSELPIPLRVDGREVQSEGTTMIRWIRPLPIAESLAFPIQKTDDA